MVTAAEVTAALRGIDFPATKHQCEEYAERNGAPRRVLDAIKRLPEKPYESMADVLRAASQLGSIGFPVVRIAEALKGIDFPADKHTCIDYAERNNAPDEVLDVIKRMPEIPYDDMADVLKAFHEEEQLMAH